MMITTHSHSWRVAGWSLLAALLVIPAVAMRFTADVNWGLLDFVAAAVMLGALGIGFELLARMQVKPWHRGVIALALVGAFLLVWAELAVGIFT